MAEPPARLGPLEAWGLATFHVSLLVAGAVLAFHRAGTLGLLLAPLGTLPGIGVFVLLWGLAAWTTRRALGGLGPAPLAGGFDPAIKAAALWGGATGAAFVGVAFVVAFLVSGAPLPALAFLAIAIPFAFLGGGIVGVFAGLLDFGLLAVVERATLKGLVEP